MDRPILTSTGIFEYVNADGSVRRELRLPEDVFDPESLKSYKGRPIIVTHDAGLITKDNVAEEQIGTIMSEGYRSGDDVRAEIIIHDTDEMKASGLKELSLGYNLDLDETPGVWEGEPYDAIQRNIRVNHLALVKEARAGDQARLNIDSRDPVLKGGKLMKKKTKKSSRADGILSPEELKKAVEEYKAKYHGANEDDDDEETAVPAIPAKASTPAITEDDEDETAPDGDVEEKLQFVKDRRDRRDEEGDPETLGAAKKVIANQDEDNSILIDIIDTLLAQIAFDCEETNEDDDEDEELIPGNEDEDDEELTEDEDDEELIPENEDEDEDEELVEDEDDEDEELAEDEDDEEMIPVQNPKKMNSDSVDKIVRERVAIAKAASALNMDGLERIKPRKAKKTIIKAVRPGIRLDGKSNAYINAAFDLACQEIEKSSRKDTMYQRRQMFNADSKSARRRNANTPEANRQKMIKRMQNTKKEV